MTLLLLVIALLFAFGCDIYDVTMTEKGLKAGVAVEGFDWLVGDKPSARALYLRDALVIAFATAPAVVFLAIHNAPLSYAGLVGPAIAGIKHIMGGLAWKKLLAAK